MVFKNRVKNIQAAAYNGARMVYIPYQRENRLRDSLGKFIALHKASYLYVSWRWLQFSSWSKGQWFKTHWRQYSFS